MRRGVSWGGGGVGDLVKLGAVVLSWQSWCSSDKNVQGTDLDVQLRFCVIFVVLFEVMVLVVL
jgi:hypothetical protein